MLDVFHTDAFTIVSLTDAINKMQFVPGYLGSLGLFTESSINTTAVAVEEQNGILRLVPPTPRGAPGVTIDKTKRALRLLSVPHFEVNDAVMAEEVQNIRPFGEETGEEAVMAKVAERMQTAGQSFEATMEYSRVGAILGIVTYADGSTLNLYNEFGVAGPPADIDFNLDAAAPAPGILRQQCAAVIRTMANSLGGTPLLGVGAICGDQFYDGLIAHPEVRQTYLNTQAAAELRQGYVNGGLTFGSFPFGGIEWTNYRGSVGGTPFVDTAHAYFYPIGVPGMFKTVFAPADYIETVNTLGKPRYVKQYDMPNGKGVHLDTQQNALNYCTRPSALLRGKYT
ncbi:major capsid protein [Bradyrhizobium sp. BRP23]|uniref:major capsid protein n=1 Tax=Bradyrhizobium sp. BRP23 TaxID=2793820 RepID=UPI001CD3AA3A|nr:major capsid protein [Bradyrhizobium sp. BRP23]MCA1419486.1 major capsid protein [Bradyrhizobium sp. BRP23]